MSWEEAKRAQEERERDAEWMKAHAQWMKEHFSPANKAKRAQEEEIFWTRWNRVREENMNRLEQKIEKLDQLEESKRRERHEAATAKRKQGKMVTALGCTPAADTCGVNMATCAGAMRKRVRLEAHCQEELNARFACAQRRQHK